MRRAVALTAVYLCLCGIASAQSSRDDWSARRARLDQRASGMRAATGSVSENVSGQAESPAISGALTLLSSRSFPDSGGDLVVVGEVQNATQFNLTFSRPILDFYSGVTFLGSDYSYAFGSQNGRLALTGSYVDVLPPGGIGFFKIWTSIPYSAVSSFVFRSDAETYGLLPTYGALQFASGVTLSGNIFGGTDYSGLVGNPSSSFTTYFTRVAVAGYLNGVINDVDFTFVTGNTPDPCGAGSSSAVAPASTTSYSGYFLQPVNAIGRAAISWDEFGIVPAAQSFAASGGGGSVTVVGDCAWTAVSNAPSWISVVSAASGSHDATVSFVVAPNGGTARVGTIAIAGQTFTVSQAGTCDYAITPGSATVIAAAGSLPVTVTTAAGCGWNATSNAAFLTVMNGTARSGTGAFTILVARNSSTSARSGSVTIAGRPVTIQQAGARPPGDFTGDGIADLALFRPGNGNWMLRDSAADFASGPDLPFGLPTDKPVPGDYDNDGRIDVAVWRPSNGIWYVILSSSGSLVQLQWGVSTDIPIQADYTGDGRTDLAVWRPANGVWYIFDLATGTYTSRQWGVSTDIPLTGDYDGDGKADVAAFRPSNGYWYVFHSSTQSYVVYQWGVSTDIPLPADYNGDGKTDLAVFRPANGYWFVFDLNTGTYGTYQWGISSDVPAPKDYDGDGRADLAVWREATGQWLLYFLGTNTWRAVTHGAAGDQPIR